MNEYSHNIHSFTYKDNFITNRARDSLEFRYVNKNCWSNQDIGPYIIIYTPSNKVFICITWATQEGNEILDYVTISIYTFVYLLWQPHYLVYNLRMPIVQSESQYPVQLTRLKNVWLSHSPRSIRVNKHYIRIDNSE